jgi:hypothetical protein
MTLNMVATVIGMIGVFVVLLSYILLQLQRIDPYSFGYSFLNFLGSAMVLFSLYFEWNLPAVVIEVVWGFISLYGVYRAIFKKNAE